MIRAVLAGACAAGALFAAAPAGAAEPQFADRFVAASPSNYPRTQRPAWLIRKIVVHTAEGSYAGTISWFRNPRARVSAHYVVSRDAQVTQMVPLSRSAWHAGNGAVNRTSVGIEHEGYAGIPWMFGDAGYRASARVTAAILRSRVLPIDRRHVIGHNEVPDPNRKGRFGGFDHHTDPGPNWDWTRYLAYVRSYARGIEPPARFDVRTPGLGVVAWLAGIVRWEAVPTGAQVDRVEFRVDGALRQVVRTPPYVFGDPTAGWSAASEPPGRRVLTVRAVAADGRVAGSSTLATFRTVGPPPPPPPTPPPSYPPPPEVLDVGLAEGAAVCGPVRWEPRVAGPAQTLEFYVDGETRDRRTTPPFVFGGNGGTWDTSAEWAGWHVVGVRASAGPEGDQLFVRVLVVAPPCPPG